jgi:hypothetical protein
VATWQYNGFYLGFFNYDTSTFILDSNYIDLGPRTFNDDEDDNTFEVNDEFFGTEVFVGYTDDGMIVTGNIDNGDHYLSVPPGGNRGLDGNVSVTQGTFTVCFLAGTRIATPSGETTIEDLRPGDLVLTAEGRALPVRWVGRQARAARFAHPLRELPVEIAAGALGGGLPRRELRVSPAHALCVGGVLVEAGALVNGTTIRCMPRDELPERFTYFHVELATHELLLAEGAPAESFVDHAEPRCFDNAEERATLLGPDVPPIREMDLPRATSARQLPRAVRRVLAEAEAKLAGLAAA